MAVERGSGSPRDSLRPGTELVLDLLDSLKDPVVFAVDHDQRYLYFNTAHVEAMRAEYAVEIAVGRPLAECMTRNPDLENCAHSFALALAGTTHSRVDSFGEGWHFESAFSPIMNRAGEIIGASCLARDVTERVRADRALAAANLELKAAEQRLAEQERAALRRSSHDAHERYRRIVESTEEGIWTIDADAITDFVNPKMASMMGYTPEEMIGRPLVEFIAEELRPAASSNIKRREQGIAEHHEFCLQHKSGAAVWTTMISNPIIDADGVYVGALAMVTDVTARRQAAADQARLESQLEQARKLESVGRLAGGVAHDFNNMLGVIIGHACLALEAIEASHPLYEDLRAIRQAADRSADVTRQLLTVARKQAVAPEVLDVGEKVGVALNLIRRLLGENLDLRWTPQPGLWPVRLDPSQLTQIITNLLVNARDAIADVGTIVITADNVVVGPEFCAKVLDAVPGDYVRVTVEDNGTGIPPEVLPHIFEPFFTTKGVGKGTGLGLASLYGSVRQGGGFVDVSSVVGAGATFSVYFPRCDDIARTPLPARLPVAGGSETILVVEDEPAVLSLATRALMARGYRVLSADNPRVALDLADTHRGDIHLLVTDVIMPDMNGRDLAETLTARRGTMKTLFMSGYTADLIPVHGLLDDGRRFLQKPFTIDELAAVIREILDGAAG